jgi:Ankyrin repeats (3 copies)
MPPAARSVEELFPLIEFCKNGDLKAVSDWIAKGNPLDLPPDKKTRRASPLQIAIEKGFLTLTEILLDGGADPSSNGNALWVAVSAKRIDIVRLLLDRGVPVNAVDFESVCYSCDPELIQLFLDRGADPITGYPIYRGFQNVLKPIIAVYKANIEAWPALQLQANMALCYFAKKGNLRCVSLLLWAGARPDAKIPEDDSKADFSDSCAFEEAVRAEQLEALKKMQPEKYPERLPELLEWCTSDSAPKMLQYLLTLLPDLSVLPDSGSSILDRPFWRLGWAAEPKQYFGTRDTQKIDAIIDSIEILVKHDAKWKPETDCARSARRYFRHLEPARILRVFTILKEHQAADIAFLESLVATPTMRSHLGDASKKITHLFPPSPSEASRAGG